MKYIISQLTYFTRNKKAKRDTFLLFRFFLVLVFIITTYSIFFHVLMLHEGKEFSWITGFYWTLTVMSTLGFGDITFKSDIGLIFSIVVLLTGIVYLLVMLPFTFIQFFYAPWLEAQEKARTPKELPEETKNHIIVTNLDPITINLIKKLSSSFDYDYVILVDELQKAQELYNLGYKAVWGDYGDPETYNRLRVHNAAMVIATNDDMINTSITFTIREVSKTVPIVTSANEEHSFDILKSAGSTHTFQFSKMLGKSLGRRTIGGVGANILWQHGQLLIAEAPAMRTALMGKTLAETKLREKTGATVVGVWERGHFESAKPQTIIDTSTVLVLAGSAQQLKNFDSYFSINCTNVSIDAPTLILGGGRVGNAAAEALEEQKIPYKIVEKNRTLTANKKNYIYGNAADISILRKSGIMEARSVIITTHNDDMNIYLTIYCRQLRPDVQIISRANGERTVSKLHRAGADLVMSYASMAANTIINLLNQEQMLMIVEGLSIFRASAQHSLAGKSLSENQIREESGCSVVAITREDKLVLNPDPFNPLELNDELILIGTAEAEKNFKERYGVSVN